MQEELRRKEIEKINADKKNDEPAFPQRLPLATGEACQEKANQTAPDCIRRQEKTNREKLNQTANEPKWKA